MIKRKSDSLEELLFMEKAWLLFGNICAIIICIGALFLIPISILMSGFAYDDPNANVFLTDMGILLYFILLFTLPWLFLWSSFRSWKWYNGESDKLANYAFLHPFVPIIIVIIIFIVLGIS